MTDMDRDTPCTLCPADVAALDALVEAGFEPHPSNAVDPRRMHRILDLLSNVDVADDELTGLSLLRRRTLEAVAAMGREARRAAIIGLEDTRRFVLPSFGWREPALAAASVVLLVSVVGPLMAGSEVSARSYACRQNLMTSAHGFTQYAADHRGALPVALEARDDRDWLRTRDNSANLFVLPREGYVSLASLTCPENPRACSKDEALRDRNWSCIEEISFSYQNVLCANRPSWSDGPAVPVLGDRNPVVDGILAGRDVIGNTNSFSHRLLGQNVLFTDGHVEWLDSPRIGSDNIWLPEGMDCSQKAMLKGSETPARAHDAMLIH